ncbi:MAG TPA: hypothetical protein DD670_00960 [Planctomycetaceae bacterium]|nr:hypothetical protein [Planctomycetaceae bacterium]
MGSQRVLFCATACVFVALAATAMAYTPADLYVHYPFDDASGTVWSDASPNNNDATSYRSLKFSELSPLDVSGVTAAGAFGNALTIGTSDIGGVNHEALVDVTTAANLPGTGDSFAVSFWLNTSAWNNYGMVASYNLNGLEWSVGNQSGNMLVWSKDGDAGVGAHVWTASMAGLAANTYAHFLVQYEGASGATNVYINGAASTDTGATNYFWGNESEGVVLGGRVLLPRDFTGLEARLDDFAILPGVLTPTQRTEIATLGVASASVVPLLHYALDETSGSALADSSPNGNTGTLLGLNSVTERPAAPRDVSKVTVPGVHGTAAMNSGDWGDYARLEGDPLEIESEMPSLGDELTISFWYKPAQYLGWDHLGIVASQQYNDLGFSVGLHNSGNGYMIFRSTTGAGTTGTKDTYGVDVSGLDPDEFHHFAITLDANALVTGFYVDGEHKAEGYNNGWNVSDLDSSGLFCRITGGLPSTRMYGYLDDYAVIAGQLSAAEVARVMDLGVAAAAIPEPATTALLLIGVLGGTMVFRRPRG